MAITMALRRVSPACLRPAARRNAGRMMFNVRAFKEDKPAENEKKEVVPQQKQDKAISQRQPEEVLPFMRMSDAMRQMQREMDAMMHSFGLWDPLSASLLRGSWNLPSLFEDRDWAPVAGPSMGRALSRVVPVEVEESDTAYTLHAEVPGFTKQDIKVVLDPSSNLLTISGEKKAEEAAEGEKQEGAPRLRSRMSFTRAFALPQDVDLNQAMTAKTENGVLTLTLPKAPAPPKPSVKEITVE